MNKITETFRGSRQFSNSCFPENTGFCFSLCFSYAAVHARKEYRLIRRNTTTALPFSLAPRWLHTQVTHTLSQVGSHCDCVGANSGLLSRFPSQEGSRPPVTELSSAHPPAGRTEFAFPPAALVCIPLHLRPTLCKNYRSRSVPSRVCVHASRVHVTVHASACIQSNLPILLCRKNESITFLLMIELIRISNNISPALW